MIFFLEVQKLLDLDGITLLSLDIDNEYLNAEILDRYYLNVSQMMGRVNRILSKTVPLSVKFFRINLVDYQSGYSVSQVIVERERLRKFELMFDGPAKLWQYVEIENSSSGINPFLSLSNNPIAWSFYPDVDIMLFDPHSPINGSLGWEATLSYRLNNSTTINSRLNNQFSQHLMILNGVQNLDFLMSGQILCITIET